MSRLPFAIWCRRVARRWVAHRHTDNAAALSFYSLISLVPLLLFGVTVAGLVLGPSTAQGELKHQLIAVVGHEAAGVIDGILQSARIAPVSNPAAFCVAMVTLLYSGSHVLSKLRDALNQVFGGGLLEPPRSWLARMISRGLCASLIFVFGAILIAGTVLDGAASYVSEMSPEWIDRLEVIKGYRWASTYLLLSLAFFVILKVLPRHRPRWGYALIGATFGAMVVGSLKSVLDHFMTHTFWGSLAGGGLSIMVFFFWLFFSIQAFLVGAEITAWLGRKAKRRERNSASG